MATCPLCASVSNALPENVIKHNSHKFIVSGILSLVSVGRFVNSQHNTASTLKTLLGWESILEFPYSLFLFGTGGILLFIVALLLILKTLLPQPSKTPGLVLDSDGSINSSFQDNQTHQQGQFDELASVSSSANQGQPHSLPYRVPVQQTTVVSQSTCSSGAPYLPPYESVIAESSGRTGNIPH